MYFKNQQLNKYIQCKTWKFWLDLDSGRLVRQCRKLKECNNYQTERKQIRESKGYLKLTFELSYRCRNQTHETDRNSLTQDETYRFEIQKQQTQVQAQVLSV